jgi:hypothetical protein
MRRGVMWRKADVAQSQAAALHQRKRTRTGPAYFFAYGPSSFAAAWT